MCRLVKDRLSHVHDEELRSELRLGIWALKLSDTKEIFEAGCNLYLKKFANKNQEVDDFLAYFEKNWINDKASLR